MWWYGVCFGYMFRNMEEYEKYCKTQGFEAEYDTPTEGTKLPNGLTVMTTCLGPIYVGVFSPIKEGEDSGDDNEYDNLTTYDIISHDFMIDLFSRHINLRGDFIQLGADGGGFYLFLNHD